MEIISTGQSPARPNDAPLVVDPVLVYMGRPVYYVTERGPTLSSHPIFCSKALAETVLTPMHEVLESADWSIAHVGVYNPRQARRASGALIKPTRWSNHAHGLGIDVKGIVTTKGQLIGIAMMKQKHSTLLENLLADCATRIKASHRRPEIVDEGGWIHIGLWP